MMTSAQVVETSVNVTRFTALLLLLLLLCLEKVRSSLVGIIHMNFACMKKSHFFDSLGFDSLGFAKIEKKMVGK